MLCQLFASSPIPRDNLVALRKLVLAGYHSRALPAVQAGQGRESSPVQSKYGAPLLNRALSAIETPHGSSDEPVPPGSLIRMPWSEYVRRLDALTDGSVPASPTSIQGLPVQVNRGVSSRSYHRAE